MSFYNLVMGTGSGVKVSFLLYVLPISKPQGEKSFVLWPVPFF